jgi:hypothetical protein
MVILSFIVMVTVFHFPGRSIHFRKHSRLWNISRAATKHIHFIVCLYTDTNAAGFENAKQERRQERH